MGEQKNITKCKGCGMPIFYKDGTPWYYRKVPVLVEVQGGEYKTTGYVSHFVNCPKASSFSKGKKS